MARSDDITAALETKFGLKKCRAGSALIDFNGVMTMMIYSDDGTNECAEDFDADNNAGTNAFF
ncbi:hypothetical protein BGX24_002712 [Mortierella sp. AD032]|nr:hypothetical protein BGX24_002712 [Mortierella sp. AD032]